VERVSIPIVFALRLFCLALGLRGCTLRYGQSRWRRLQSLDAPLRFHLFTRLGVWCLLRRSHRSGSALLFVHRPLLLVSLRFELLSLLRSCLPLRCRLRLLSALQLRRFMPQFLPALYRLNRRLRRFALQPLLLFLLLTHLLLLLLRLASSILLSALHSRLLFQLLFSLSLCLLIGGLPLLVGRVLLTAAKLLLFSLRLNLLHLRPSRGLLLSCCGRFLLLTFDSPLLLHLLVQLLLLVISLSRNLRQAVFSPGDHNLSDLTDLQSVFLTAFRYLLDVERLGDITSSW
jgi:hypothetical protein